MTRTKRVLSFLQGLLMIVFALILVFLPENGIKLVLAIVGIGMTLRGFRTLIYYLTMARFMVSGRMVLYRGIIFLNVGLFTSSLVNNPGFYTIMYIAGLNLFTGVVALMGALEAKRISSPRWRMRAIRALIAVSLAVIAIIGGMVYHNTEFAVYVYAFGLIYSAFGRMAMAFRKTAIAYIP